MSRAASGRGISTERRCRYRGVRRRSWGKWVSEIRVPGTRERLWLGSYAAPESAAVAHDAAACLLRGLAPAAAAGHLNFPERAACYYAAYRHSGHGTAPPMSPRSVQRVASDAGMAADARAALASSSSLSPPVQAAIIGTTAAGVGIGAARGGDGGATAQAAYAPPPPYSNCSSSSSSACWATPSAGSGSKCSSAGSDQQLVYGDISVDDIEILM
ncbi:hypothetical protein HU200_008087 [Digitaria exilis]|uniref:AP2/ERF domain-containing protein n=1 Tax=Digitaria exilis TaxID=1010633 RepID=A0A835FLR8_9POAL|nr:hypothetical protein HU200_008087 [Digitaria exilis]